MTTTSNTLLNAVTAATVGTGVQYTYLANSPTSFSVAVSATSGAFTALIDLQTSPDNVTWTSITQWNVSQAFPFTGSFSSVVASLNYMRAVVSQVTGTGTAITVKAVSTSDAGIGTIDLSSGTVSAPALYLSSDNTSGVYRVAANDIGVAISGTKVLDVNSTGLGVTGGLVISGQSTLPTVLSGATANFTDFPRAQVVVSTANTGVTDPGIHALVCESKSDGTYNAHGLDGCAATNGTGAGIGISGTGRVTATGDTGGAFGVFASADTTHAGGANYGVYSSATNGATNYSFYGAAGTLYNAGGINTTPIGNVTPSTGAFTTLSATGDVSLNTSGSLNQLNFYQASEGTNLKRWVWQQGSALGAGIMRLRMLDDAVTTGINALTFTRTSYTTVNIMIGSDTNATVNIPGAVTMGNGLAVTGTVNVNGTAASTTVGQLNLGATTQATIGANGAASALTANPLGYLIAYVGTTKVVIPYYNA